MLEQTVQDSEQGDSSRLLQPLPCRCTWAQFMAAERDYIANPHAGARRKEILDVITTTLKRRWFAEIVAGRKRIEYRKFKPYWTHRLRRVRTPFRLVLRNGMTPLIPVLTVRVDRVTPSPKRPPRAGTYALHIGRILKVEYWDRRNARPR